jgi:hypothetical protein
MKQTQLDMMRANYGEILSKAIKTLLRLFFVLTTNPYSTMGKSFTKTVSS